MPKVVDIRIEDHSDEVLKELKDMIPTALAVVGEQAVDYAQDECPVDIGALRNSIAWATSEKNAGSPKPGAGSPSKPKGKPEDNAVYIGSNLEYAESQEFGNFKHKVGKKHFLRDSVAKHQDHYKAIIKAALGG